MTPKLALLLEAKRRHGTISRCGTRFSLWDCFMDMGRYGLALYYNTPDGNTHLVRQGGNCVTAS